MDTGFVKGRRGAVFKPETGKLYLFDSSSVSVLQGWPVMRAWKKTGGEHPGWAGSRPPLRQLETELRMFGERQEKYRRELEDGQLELPLTFAHRDEANPYVSETSRWYFETTPCEIRELLRPFWNSRWALLTMLADGGKPAADLLKSCPALAFMLANNRIFHTPAVLRPRRAIRAWFAPGKPRRRLLAWLGFPSAANLPRLLAKVPPQDLTIGLMLKLRALLQEPHWEKLLRHQPVIDRALLAFFEPDMLEMLTPRLLTELRSDLFENLTSEVLLYTDPEQQERERRKLLVFWRKDDQPAWILLRDTARMFADRHPDHPMPPVRDLAALRRLHDRLAEEFAIRHNTLVFRPPVPGNADIIPLTNYAMLCEESRQQHNCAASYYDEIAAGRSFLYRVLAPERCTLELAPRGRRWAVAQLRTAFNGAPCEATVLAVARWLDAAQQAPRLPEG